MRRGLLFREPILRIDLHQWWTIAWRWPAGSGTDLNHNRQVVSAIDCRRQGDDYIVEAGLIVRDIRGRGDRGGADNHADRAACGSTNAGGVHFENSGHGRTTRARRSGYVERLGYTPRHCRIS